MSIKYLTTKVVNSVPYRLEYTVPAGNPIRSTPLFRTGKNNGYTGHIGQFRAIPVSTDQFRAIPSVPVGTEKSCFFFFFKFCNF